MAIPLTLANFTTSLASKITSAASSLTLVSATTKNGTTLPTGTYGLTIDEGTNSEEHMIVALTGTAGTISTRGISVVDGKTNVSALQFEHRRGASVKMTDHPGLIRIINRLNGDEAFDTVNWTGVNSVSGLATPTAGETTKAANVAYVNAVAIAGASDATSSAKGIVEIATDAELQAGTGTGSTGAKVVAAGDSFKQTPTANKVPVADSSGKLAAGWGGSASTLATLDSSSLVVQNPANATATPTASKIPIADSGGTLVDWIGENRMNVQTFVAGENIDASGGPKAVYLKESDGRVYKLDSTSAGEAIFQFIGFAIVQSAVTTGNNIKIQTDGVVAGFSGLTVGGYYFGTNTAGTVSTTAGSVTYRIGRAITSSTMLISVGIKTYNGSSIITASGTTTITPGFRVSRVRIWAVGDSSAYISVGGWSVNTGNRCSAISGGGSIGNTYSYAYHIGQPGTPNHVGTITNITSTSFDISDTENGTAVDVRLVWEAEG